ncbi:serine hydrolase [Candidatus Saccharibacteria bacterium]|nr:serine hydrolase [Candidatus Saccharibacteria bacterium]
MKDVVSKSKKLVFSWVAWIRASVKKHWHLWALLGVVTLMVLTWQVTYPSDKTLPWARLAGESSGRASQEDVVNKLKTDYATVPLTLDINGKISKTTAAQAGVEVDDVAVLKGLTYYPWWQRIIPYSLFFIGPTKNQQVSVKLDKTRFDTYAKTISDQCKIAPKDAGVVVKDNEVKLDPAKNGQACPASLLQSTFEKIGLQKNGVIVKLLPVEVSPDRTDKDVASVLKEAQKVADRQLVIEMLDTRTTVPKEEIASWLQFPQDEKTKQIRVDIDTERVKSYLADIQTSIYIAPGTTRVQTLNGSETSRSVGSAGRGIDTSATAEAVRKQLLDKDGTVVATLAKLQPSTAYDRSYTATQAGLQALIDDIVKDKGDYAISIRTLDGVTANTNGTKHYHPASTYKMFVGWAIILRISAGQMNWNDSATNGKNVSQCFDAMIVNSDNACGEWLGEQIGWTKLNNMLKGIGLTCTNLSTAWYSCANDESLFLYKLQTGQLLPADQAERLLSVMRRQVYRSGIPAGVSGTVADKVGFLYGLLHDSAIVYSPYGTYVLTIMTDGSSWGQIADAAKQIDAQLSRL